MEVTLQEILTARENRVAKQQELLARFGKSLICFTMNIAGPEKYNEDILWGYELGKKWLQVQVKDFSDTPQIAVGPVWAGLDMAHAGDRDKHVFCAIQGNVLLALHQFGVADGIEVAGWIRKFNAAYKIAGLNCDLAWSESVFDQLKFELPIAQIPFGGAAEDKAQYENVRAEMYFAGARKIRDDALYVYMESEWIDPSLVVELKRDMSNIHWIQAKKSNKK